MNKTLSMLVFLTAIIALQVTSIAQTPPSSRPETADEQKLAEIQLAPPVLDKGIPVMQALKKRQSVREFSDTKLSTQQLSELLWAADGVNRDSGGRTAPSAMAKYPVDIYAARPEGVYLYEPSKHRLLPVAVGDFRKEVGRQGYVFIAPLNLVYVADFDRFDGTQPNSPDDQKLKMAAIEAGCIAQNVYLYCASEGLGATVRTSIDGGKFGSVIKLRPSQRVICAQTVGNPK